MQEILADFNLAVAKVNHQTTKFNSPPNFPAIRYPENFSDKQNVYGRVVTFSDVKNYNNCTKFNHKTSGITQSINQYNL